MPARAKSALSQAGRLFTFFLNLNLFLSRRGKGYWGMKVEKGLAISDRGLYIWDRVLSSSDKEESNLDRGLSTSEALLPILGTVLLDCINLEPDCISGSSEEARGRRARQATRGRHRDI